MKRKMIPIGYEDFKEIIEKNMYFVDKSYLIQGLLEHGGKVMLFTRPRRFGKTLNLSMIFESALKTNDVLAFGVVTGCLRISRESGTGRPDLLLKTQAIRRGRAMILELKVAKSVAKMEETCQEALGQIEEHQYEQELRKEGYPRVDKYGICFYRKECMIKKLQ